MIIILYIWIVHFPILMGKAIVNFVDLIKMDRRNVALFFFPFASHLTIVRLMDKLEKLELAVWKFYSGTFSWVDKSAVRLIKDWSSNPACFFFFLKFWSSFLYVIILYCIPEGLRQHWCAQHWKMPHRDIMRFWN